MLKPRGFFTLMAIIMFLLFSNVLIYATAVQQDAIQEQSRSSGIIPLRDVRNGTGRVDILSTSDTDNSDDGLPPEDIRNGDSRDGFFTNPSNEDSLEDVPTPTQEPTHTQEPSQSQEPTQSQDTAQTRKETPGQDTAPPPEMTPKQEVAHTQETARAQITTQPQESTQAWASTQTLEPTPQQASNQAPGQRIEQPPDNKINTDSSSQTGSGKTAVGGNGINKGERAGGEEPKGSENGLYTNRTITGSGDNQLSSIGENQPHNSVNLPDEARPHSSGEASITVTSEPADVMEGFRNNQSSNAHSHLPGDNTSEFGVPDNTLSNQVFKGNQPAYSYGQSSPPPSQYIGVATNISLGLAAVFFFALLWVKARVRANP